MGDETPLPSRRLKQFRAARGLSTQALAEATDTTNQQIGRLEVGIGPKGRKLTWEWAVRLAPALEVEAKDFFKDDQTVESGAKAPAPVPPVSFGGEDYAPIPVYDARLAAGAGGASSGIVRHHILFRVQWLRSVTNAPIENLGIAEVDGDSMEPTLRPGDHVLVDLSQIGLRRNGIFALRAEDGLQIKRVSYNEAKGILTVSSDNPAYRSYDISDPSAVSVLGRVIWVGRRI